MGWCFSLLLPIFGEARIYQAYLLKAVLLEGSGRNRSNCCVWNKVIYYFHPLLLLIPAPKSRVSGEPRLHETHFIDFISVFITYHLCRYLKKNLNDTEWLDYLYTEATSQVVKFIQNDFCCWFEDPQLQDIGGNIITIFWKAVLLDSERAVKVILNEEGYAFCSVWLLSPESVTQGVSEPFIVPSNWPKCIRIRVLLFVFIIKCKRKKFLFRQRGIACLLLCLHVF